MSEQSQQIKENKEEMARQAVALQEEMIEQQHKLEELQEDMKVFKDCAIDEFIQIVGPQYDKHMPLFANLYILREHHIYHHLIHREALKYSIPVTVGLNFAWYYGMRRYYRGQPFMFNRITRTFTLFALFGASQYRLVAEPKLAKNYRVNINHLFDRDESFLYENPAFRSAVRRINDKYTHLINPAFEVSDHVTNLTTSEDKKFDAKYQALDELNTERFSRFHQDGLRYYYFGCFNVNKSMKEMTLENLDVIVDRYDEQFNTHREEIQHKLKEVTKHESIWQHIQIIVQTLG